ncbi:unnamed protein product, partial [Urochloa humidicola]
SQHETVAASHHLLQIRLLRPQTLLLGAAGDARPVERERAGPHHHRAPQPPPAAACYGSDGSDGRGTTKRPGPAPAPQQRQPLRRWARLPTRSSEREPPSPAPPCRGAPKAATPRTWSSSGPWGSSRGTRPRRRFSRWMVEMHAKGWWKAKSFLTVEKRNALRDVISKDGKLCFLYLLPTFHSLSSIS